MVVRFHHWLWLLCCGAGALQAAPRWQFTATIDAAAASLALSACSNDAQPEVHFRAGVDGAFRQRHAVRRDSERAIAIDRDRIDAADWRAGECLHLHVDLAAAARAEHRALADRAGERFVLDPGRWLWRPERIDPGSEIRFELPPQWRASVPWQPVDDSGLHYRVGSTPMRWSALVAFGRFEEHALEHEGGRLRVALLPPWSGAELARIEAVADTLLRAYGRLPRSDAQVLIVPLPGHREAAPWGQVTRGGGSAVHLFVGAEAGVDALVEDWTATHEFSHLLHPYLGDAGRWLGEGLASYYQNVLRARSGALGAADAWRKIEEGFERGAKEQRSPGLSLDEASRRMGSLHNFMRVYWSGTAYWLDADLALRARGSSLDAALRAYAECCLADAQRVAPEDFVARLDRIVGADVFVPRYRAYAAAVAFPDLAPLRARMRQQPDDVAAIMRAR